MNSSSQGGTGPRTDETRILEPGNLMTVTCPDPARLQGVLDSSLTDAEYAELVAHLDSCPSCQIALERIAASGSSILEIARGANQNVRPEETSAFWPALHRVEREIESPAAAMTVTRAEPVSESTTARDRLFEFFDPPDDPTHLGQINRFQIVELVGRGGMGMVFRAFDACLQRTIAVKVLDPQYGKNDLARSRFIREARAAAAVAHENVVTIHHVECVEAKGLSFFVMQFVKGRSLQDRLDAGGPLPVREAVRIAAQTAAGLAAAHENGLIHRDIKPGNILLEQGSGRVLLTDFGLARLTEDVKLTQTGFVAGTPLYMSPEQARGETVDHRSDLFSLGSVLYAMLTGVPPFQGSSPFTVLKQVTDSRHRPVQDVNPAVPDSVCEIVDRLMAKDPRHRYAVAAEVAAALNAELANLPVEPVTAPSGRPSSRTVPRYFRSWWRRRSLPVLGAVAGLFGLLLLTELTRLTQWTVIGQRGRPAVVSGSTESTEEPETPVAYSLPPGDGAVWSVAFDPCGQLLATTNEGGNVRFWDAADGHIRGELTQRRRSPVWSVAFNNDGSKLVTAHDDGAVRLWDVQTRKESEIVFDHMSPVRSVAFSPDGKRLASGTRNGAVTVWNAETGKPIRSWIGHDGGVIASIAFYKDGKLLATAGSDKTIKLWDSDDGTAQTTLIGHTGPIYALAFDPRGRYLASGGWDHTIRIWDKNTSQLINTFGIHKGDVWSLAFCPEGSHLISGSTDGTARWLEVESGTVKRVFRGRSPVHGVAVSTDGKLIAGGCRDGIVRVWHTEP
jgi:eukaryotic-like serine/threonine-protein kinase